jgi:uracil-DNA glycosylase
MEQGWQKHLDSEFKKEYMISLRNFILDESKNNKIIYPKENEFYSAFNASSFKKTKVVIIGQDPYHGPGQAHGLSFSVLPGVRVPPSLKNIYKELKNDLNIDPPNHGYLQSWADQGVLLLNNVLSVEHSKAGSHQKKGWEEFTNKVIQILNTKKKNLVFILWGSPAHKKGATIDSTKHLILKSVHPSPLSSYRGFFGNNHFSKTNTYLKVHGKTPIKWELPLT